MNWDEFDYYFELKELEPFADAPLSDLFLNAACEANSKATQQPLSPVVAASEPTEVASAPATPVSSSYSPPANTASENVPSASPAFQNPPSRTQVTGGADSESTAPRPRITELPWQGSSATRSGNEVTSPETSCESPAPGRNEPGAIKESPRDRPESPKARGRWQGDFDQWQERMSVHVLGQFAFCNRAGIYSAENGDETDLDEPPPNWSYLPNFDLERIEEQLSKLLRQSLQLLLVSAVFLLAMVGGVWGQDRRILYAASVGMFFTIMGLQTTVGGLLILLWRRAAARRARGREPDPAINSIQPANWWSLLKAGFDAVPYQRQFRHPYLPLEGCPWRVMERGSLRIPVIKSGADKLGDAKHRIYPKHELRLAAYAMLLEATEHVQVPYGLIFPSDSPLGLAIPISPALREQVVEQLQRARELIERSQSGESEPRLPQDRNRCVNCRLGEPEALADSEINVAKKSRKRLVVLKDSHERKFHCACADRFGSAPPHRRILQLGLSATVE